MADDDLAGTLTGARDAVVNAVTGGATAIGKYVSPVTDALGLTTPSPGLPSQGYNRDGTPPATPVQQTPTGTYTTKNF